jgi:glycosyltransferase involved in cell wall biosynthesis
MNRSEVFILGNFGYITGHLDGQTMESRSLLQLLELNSIDNIDYFDTERLHFEKLSILILFHKLFKTKRIFYLGAQGSLKYLFPFLWIFCKIFGIEFYYFVVGGWIAEFLKFRPLHRFCLKRIKYMYCETRSIVAKLKDWYDYHHAVWFPNFRIYNFVPEIAYSDGPLRLVFMARIVKNKGFERVFELAKFINNSKIDDIIIDFYGPLFKDDQDLFFSGISQFSFVKYKGVLQPSEINSTLSKYDIMLFPTSYPGEGLPGTILDSYISGIPVIASDWLYNSELIDHGQSGFIFDLDSPSDFNNYVYFLYMHRDVLFEMKKSAHLKSKEFDSNFVWSIISESVFAK